MAGWFHHVPAVPPFMPPATAAAWQRTRTRLCADLERLLGRLPPRPVHLDVTVVSREDRGDYLLERFHFDNGAGATVPGCLLLPKAAKPGVVSPAILYHHWHGDQYELGKESIFQHEYTPVDPGPALARLGYVVLSIDAYGFGERRGQGPGAPDEPGAVEEQSASKFNLWVGRTLWGMIVRDDRIALDYLLSRPEVDPARVGATGMSMGATRTWWLMALDARVAAGVSVACLTRYSDLIEQRSLAAHGIYYYVPGILNHFDTEAIVAMAAPRPALFLTGDRDPGSPVSGVHTIESAVRPVYALTGRPGNFESVVYPGVGHEYTADMWRRTLEWMQRHLNAGESSPKRSSARRG